MHAKRGMLCLGLVMCAAGQVRENDRPLRLPARGVRGAVAAGSHFATGAAMRLYYQGGTAVDAGVAAMLAAAVTEFSHFGFGGEAPILVRTRDGKVQAIAGVGAMPRLATANLFRTRRLLPGEVTTKPDPRGMRAFVPVAGLMPALVPGMFAAALTALGEYGTRSFAEVAAPAIELADGFPIDETRVGAIRRIRAFLELWPDSRRVFLPAGRLPAPGDIFRQPDLARTLRSLVEAERTALAAGAGRVKALDAVAGYFYRGPIARRIDAFSRAHHGLLRYDDMAAFRLSPEEPVSTTYRGYQVHKPGFWSQGPSMLETLNLLEGFDLRAMAPADYIHTLVEALKLAYADRDTYYGDPLSVEVPAARLLSKEYAAARRPLIAATASLDFRPGSIGAHPPPHPSGGARTRVAVDPALAARDTTCVDTIDSQGVIFSATPSGAWLPSVIAGDTGIPLTQRAQSFLLLEGHPNELAGGKRPRITLSPTLVTREGRPAMALSTPGGDNQDQSLLQVLLNVVEFGRDASRAVEAPRFQTRHLVSSFDNHAMYPGDLLLDERTPRSVREELARRGHRIETRPPFASGSAPVLVRVLPGGAIEAGADPFGYRWAEAW